ncbi:hypothetical protein [Neobacillus sp. OS1-33]|uniref:hypothetical protein n=1 Tax=Neobacillus sp. OS1-33 TaxID=3070683 RepID=UPI0027DF58F2|nr:hypothetical protein [Neobacillus sp. OS1-33]WML26606.1 hypothetical protein RCG22_02890 [Neobacillus sp. OS1-33]
MKKKIVTSTFTLVLLLGLGTGVMAATNKIDCKVGDFKEMIPMMQEKYPDLSDKQLKEVHKDCVAKMKKETGTDCKINK